MSQLGSNQELIWKIWKKTQMNQKHMCKDRALISIIMSIVSNCLRLYLAEEIRWPWFWKWELVETIKITFLTPLTWKILITINWANPCRTLKAIFRTELRRPPSTLVTRASLTLGITLRIKTRPKLWKGSRVNWKRFKKGKVKKTWTTGKLIRQINKPWWRISCSMRATHSVWGSLKKWRPRRIYNRCPWELRSLRQVEWVTCQATTTEETFLIEIQAEANNQVTAQWVQFLSLELIREKDLLKPTFYNLTTLVLSPSAEEILTKRKTDQTEHLTKEVRRTMALLWSLTLNLMLQLRMKYYTRKKMYFNNRMMMTFV